MMEELHEHNIFQLRRSQLSNIKSSFILCNILGRHSFVCPLKLHGQNVIPFLVTFGHHPAFENKLIIFLWSVMTIDDLYFVSYIYVCTLNNLYTHVAEWSNYFSSTRLTFFFGHLNSNVNHPERLFKKQKFCIIQHLDCQTHSFAANMKYK